MFGVQDGDALVSEDQDVSVKAGKSRQDLINWQLPHRLHDMLSVTHWLPQPVDSRCDVVDESLGSIEVVDSAIQLIEKTTGHPDRDLVPSHP